MSSIPNETNSARVSQADLHAPHDNDNLYQLKTMPLRVNTSQSGSRLETGLHEQGRPIASNDFINIINMIKQKNTETHSPIRCNCLEKLRLQVSQELDHLRGAFRKKEGEIIAPIVNRYSQVEQKVGSLSAAIERIDAKTSLQEANMLV